MAFSSKRQFSLNAKVNAEEVVQELITLERITPEDIIIRAQNTSSALNKYFEWDDTKAAHGYRLQQARHLVISIQIEDLDGNSMKAFESVLINDSREYLAIDKIAEIEDLVAQVLQTALRELLYWKLKNKKYEKYFGKVFGAIEEAEITLKEKKHGEKEERNKGSSASSRGKASYPANKKDDGINHYNRGLTINGEQV